MVKVLLVYAPFCTPATPPYALTNLYSFLKANSDFDVDVLDLNLEFHKLKFPVYQEYFKDCSKWQDYDKVAKEYHSLTHDVYTSNNKRVVSGEKPEYFSGLLAMIKERKPDYVAFSIVYSSQVFYAYSLISELTDIKTIVGGPAVSDKLKEVSKYLKNETGMLSFISGKAIDTNKISSNTVPDFSIYDLDEYFTPKPVIPLKTTSTCFYKQCTFCTHYNDSLYFEYPIEQIKEAIVKSGQRYFFLIDDMIPVKRLLEIASVFKPLDIKWTCQLRPTKEFTYDVLKSLSDSGLVMVMWGVESGCDRILKLIKKGTNVPDIETVLSDSHKAGIKNIAYMIFGFPSETKQEFLSTVDFLKRNSGCIDLVSMSVFGLQRGTFIYDNPLLFGITNIVEEKRTLLPPMISYSVSSGLSQEEAKRLRQRYKATIAHINKYPRSMNFFREHMLVIL